MVIEFEWEVKFEFNIYGFRLGRSCMDVVEGIKVVIKQKSKYVLNVDIVKCFDNIDYEKLLDKIGIFLKVRRQIKVWFKFGVYDNELWFLMDEGIF